MRVVLSRGVWLVIGAQLLLLALLRRPWLAEGAADAVHVFIVALALAAFLYIVAGLSQALAHSRDTVGVSAALKAGAQCFGPFLWLITKVALLCGVLLNLLFYAAIAVTGGDPAALSENVLRALPLAEGVVGFVLVYWLPLVFVRRNFVLLPTLRAAAAIAWRRLPHAAYVAFLTLAPALLAVFADETTPLLAVLALNSIGGVMEWVAYDYCVEWLRDQPPN